RNLKAAFAGSKAGVVFDEEKRFDLVVRLDKDYRQNLEDIDNLLVALPGGGQIPFDNLASIEIKSGPAQVSRENTKRRISVGFNVRGRDVQTVISEVSGLIDKNMKLPTGYYITYGGQFQNLEAAKARLSVAVPVALLMIFILLYFTFKSVIQTLLIYTAVPLAAIGGVFALWIRGMNFSISAGIGFIALFGVAVLNGIVLIAEFNRLEIEGITDIDQRVIKGLKNRLRSVILTGIAPMLGFLPMVISTSAGAEVQKPLATVVIGGLITATLLTLVILPILYIAISSKKLKLPGVRKTSKAVLVLLIISSSSFLIKAGAQEAKPIYLQEAIRIALDNNLSLKSSALSVNVQRALKGASWDIEKTDVDFEYGQMNSFLKDNSFTISQSFSFPSVYINQKRLANARVTSSELQLRESQVDVSTQIKQIYWKLAYLYSKQKLLLFQDSLFSRFLRAAELRAKSGETNRLEMITARSQSLEIKNQLLQNSSDIGISVRDFNTLMNSDIHYIPADTVLRKAGKIPSRDSAGIKQNPSLVLSEHEVEVSKLERNLEQSRILPDLKVGYFNQSIQGTQEINDIARLFGPGDRFTGFQAGISVPLWILPHTSKAKAARINENIARNNTALFEKSLSAAYQSVLDEYTKYSGTVEYYEKQALPEANLIVDQSSRSYRAGAMDYLEYVFSLNRALEIKQHYLDALDNYNQTIIKIEYLTGNTF
ncbi:MAG: efflux RND transporter permease subunit, partial [Bacteroidota bacterium]|nr:efflux RND transporter permease subunit [Bacteroidota bacterium]